MQPQAQFVHAWGQERFLPVSNLVRGYTEKEMSSAELKSLTAIECDNLFDLWNAINQLAVGTQDFTVMHKSLQKMTMFYGLRMGAKQHIHDYVEEQPRTEYFINKINTALRQLNGHPKLDNKLKLAPGPSGLLQASDPYSVGCLSGFGLMKGI
jgi:hypothetical protein